MSASRWHIRLALLALLLVACASGRKPVDSYDGALDAPDDQAAELAPGEAAMATVDAAAPIDAAEDAPGPRPPATRDVPASEARPPTPMVDSASLFVDDFTMEDAVWQAVDVRGSLPSAAAWPVLLGDSGSVLTQDALDTTLWHIAYAETDLGPDQIVEARLRVLAFYAPTPSYAVALFGRYDPKRDSGYFLALRADGSVALRKRERSTNASLSGGMPQGIRPGVWYTVRLEVTGSTITAFVDGAFVDSAVDEAPLAGGFFGLGAFGATVEVDHVLAAGLAAVGPAP